MWLSGALPENAIGMFVGNVATLRPLFRSFLDRTVRDTGCSSHSFRTGNSRFSLWYELSGHGKSGKHTCSATVSQVRGAHGKRRDSQLSDGDSQKQIIQSNDVQGHADLMVSRQVNITYN
jgi:hypothetical protein